MKRMICGWLLIAATVGAAWAESWGQKPLVVWLVDESKGMHARRERVLQKVKELYEILGADRKDGGDRIITAVCTFGKGFHVLLPEPTANVDEVLAAFKKVPVDSSGTENTLSALKQTVDAYAAYAQKNKRRLVIILVTDEAGDDDDPKKLGKDSPLEQTLSMLKEQDVLVLVFGGQAGAFACPKQQTYDPTVPKGTNPYGWADRGIDTAFDEMIPQDFILRTTGYVPSGFGPYGLARVSTETGGVYYLLSEKAALQYDYDKLLDGYEPELASREEIAKRNEANELRRTLAQIVADWKGFREEHRLWVYFHKNELGRKRTQECLAAADAGIKLADEHLAALAKVKDVKVEHSSKRWAANRDLMLAQLGKHRFQLEQYRLALKDTSVPPGEIGWMLSIAKLGPLRGNDLAAVIKEKANVLALFDAVIEKHAKTPWAVYAAQEKKTVGGYVISPWSRSKKMP